MEGACCLTTLDFCGAIEHFSQALDVPEHFIDSSLLCRQLKVQALLARAQCFMKMVRGPTRSRSFLSSSLGDSKKKSFHVEKKLNRLSVKVGGNIIGRTSI